MKDISIEQETRQLNISNNDLSFVSDNEQLKQSIWSTLSMNLEKHIVNNYGYEDVVLDRNYQNVDLQTIIDNLLTRNDSRISSANITYSKFDKSTRDLKLGITITTNNNESFSVGGIINNDR